VVISRRGNQITSVDEWFQHARPIGGQHQWQDGRSAKELAKAWCPVGQEPAAPATLLALLNTVPRFQMTNVEVAFPEHRVPFDNFGGMPRNADLVARCVAVAGAFTLSVEAKADEPFGPSVASQLQLAASYVADEQRSELPQRLAALLPALFRFRGAGVPTVGSLRYQLLTAAAGAIAAATTAGHDTALLLIHEFQSEGTRAGRIADNSRDLNCFIARLSNGAVLAVSNNTIVGPFRVPGNEYISSNVDLYVGKLVTHLQPNLLHPDLL
jgi:hypothetical protein